MSLIGLSSFWGSLHTVALENTLGAPIYAFSEQPSLVEAFNAIAACAAWDVTSEVYGYGITNTGSADDCVVLPAGKVLSGCIYSFSGNQLTD